MEFELTPEAIVRFRSTLEATRLEEDAVALN